MNRNEITCVRVLLVLLLSFSPSVFAQADRRDDVTTMQSFAERCLEWDLVRLRSAWERDPGRVPELDDRVNDALRDSAAYWADTKWTTLEYPNASEMLNTLEELLEFAPESRTLQLLRAESVLRKSDQDHIEASVAALDGFDDSTSLAFRRMYLASAVYASATSLGARETAEAARETVFELFEQTLQNPPRNRLFQRFAFLYLTPVLNACCEGFDLAPIAKRAKARSKDDWLALMAEGTAHQKYAWSARGRGTAETVTPEGWRVFKDRMAHAAESFTLAYQMRPAYPESAAGMIDVSKSLRGDIDEIWIWFVCVLEAESSWMPAVEEFMWAVRPRWHGTIPHMMQTVVLLAEASENNPDYEEYLFDAVVLIGEDAGTHRGIWDADPMAEAVKEVLLRRISDGRDVDRSRQRLLGIAWARREWSDASRLVEELGPQQSWRPLRQFRVHHDDVLDDVALHEVEDADLIAQGLRAESNSEYEKASRLFSKALAALEGSDPLRSALHAKVVSSDWAARYEAGEEVSLAGETGLPGWRVWTGDARSENGTIILKGGSGCWVMPALDPGSRFEMTARVTMPEGAGKAWTRIIIGYDWLRDFERWITVSFRWHDATARMRYRYTDRQSSPISEPLRDGAVQARIIRYDDDLVVFADGQLLYRGPIALGYRYTPGDGIGISAWIEGDEREAAFENITIRKLTQKPMEFEGEITPHIE